MASMNEMPAGAAQMQEALDLTVSRARGGEGIPHGPVLLAVAVFSTVWFGGLAAVARWRTASQQERFVRCQAGTMLVWWFRCVGRTWFEVGSPKVAWLPFLGNSRTALDSSVHATSLWLLVCIVGAKNLPVQLLLALGFCLIYLCAFEPLYIGDFFVTPIVLLLLWSCLPARQGALAGMQGTMIGLMVGAGLSKVGPHFDRPAIGVFALAMANYFPTVVVDCFWRGQGDMRPSQFAKVIACAMTFCEVCVPLLFFSTSKTVVRWAVWVLTLMHAGMCFGAPVLGFLEIWCVATWRHLFLGGDEQGPAFGFDYAGARAMPRCIKMLALTFVVLNVWAQLQPDLDWHPLLKYNHFASGNQPCTNPVLLRRTALPRLRERIYVDEQTARSWTFRGTTEFMLGLGHRWFAELNHKPSAAVVDRALSLCAGNISDYALMFDDEFTQVLAGSSSATMNSYNLRFFQRLPELHFLEPCDVILVWLGPVSWPILPLGRQASRWSIWDSARGLLEEGDLAAEELHALALPSSAGGLIARSCGKKEECRK